MKSFWSPEQRKAWDNKNAVTIVHCGCGAVDRFQGHNGAIPVSVCDNGHRHMPPMDQHVLDWKHANRHVPYRRDRYTREELSEMSQEKRLTLRYP